MKNIIISSLLMLLLTACGGKISNIVSFTNPVASEESGVTVLVPAPSHLSSWTDNNLGTNIAIDPSHSKFKKDKLTLRSNISTSPVIVDGKIFVLTKDGYLTAFEDTSLKQLWAIDLVNKSSKSDYIWGGITHHSGKLFVTNGSRRFYMIDSNNGNLLFSKQFPDILVTKPVIQGNVVILQTMSNQVYMIDLGNKAIVWDHVGNPETLQGGIAIDPVIAHDKAILSYTSGQVSLIDLAKRTDVWQIDLASDNTMPEYIPVNLAVTPIVDDKDVYLADNNGKIFKLNIETGALGWTKEIDDVRTINNTVNALIMTTNGRQIVALDKMSGKVLWTTYLGEKGKARTKWNPINYVSALIVNDRLNVYTSTGEYYVIDLAAGRIMQRSNVGTKLGFVTITDKIRLFDGKNIFVSKSAPTSHAFKKTPDLAEEQYSEEEPKKQSSWFKPFKFRQKEQQDAEQN